MNLYAKVFTALNKAKIEYLIVGGVAVNLHGYTRFTGDIDILLTLSPDNLTKMDNTMKKMGYVERLPITIHGLSDPKKLKKYLKDKNMKAFTYISNKQLALDVDIITEESLDFAGFNKKKKVVHVWNLDLPVIGIDDLIGMKKKAGRNEDKFDVEALLKLKML